MEAQLLFPPLSFATALYLLNKLSLFIVVVTSYQTKDELNLKPQTRPSPFAALQIF